MYIKNIIWNYKIVEDNQELLGGCDILVTDFSSCFIDFALTGRPMLFYLPDKENFITPSVETTHATNLLFEDAQIKGTCYCENVFKVVAGKVKLDN